MGRSRYYIQDNRYPYFLTGTVVRWIPLFNQPKIAQIFLDTVLYLREHYNLQLYGWVLMENHFHLIGRADDLSKTIGILKSYTGKKIVEYLHEEKQRGILTELHFGKNAHRTEQQYQVWQEGSHPEMILNREIMTQKLNYIHYNPVKRGFVDRPEEWRYSSARNYTGGVGLIPVCSSW